VINDGDDCGRFGGVTGRESRLTVIPFDVLDDDAIDVDKLLLFVSFGLLTPFDVDGADVVDAADGTTRGSNDSIGNVGNPPIPLLDDVDDDAELGGSAVTVDNDDDDDEDDDDDDDEG
jgi:hypothetical protein